MIRVATADDAAAIVEIYRPSIENSAVSFEAVVPSIEEMRGRIEKCLTRFPWLVYEGEVGVAGYAYAGEHYPRAAYRWTANVSVYVDRSLHRQGVARQLYLALFDLLEQQGVRTVIAGIAIPNSASHAFHEALGFQQAGVFTNVGFKDDQWVDVSWWQRSLGEGGQCPPPAFIPFPQLETESKLE